MQRAPQRHFNYYNNLQVHQLTSNPVRLEAILTAGERPSIEVVGSSIRGAQRRQADRREAHLSGRAKNKQGSDPRV